MCYYENNVPSRLSKQWLCSNSCTWPHDVRLHIAGTSQPKSAQQANQGAFILCSLLSLLSTLCFIGTSNV